MQNQYFFFVFFEKKIHEKKTPSSSQMIFKSTCPPKSPRKSSKMSPLPKHLFLKTHRTLKNQHSCVSLYEVAWGWCMLTSSPWTSDNLASGWDGLRFGSSRRHPSLLPQVEHAQDCEVAAWPPLSQPLPLVCTGWGNKIVSPPRLHVIFKPVGIFGWKFHKIFFRP